MTEEKEMVNHHYHLGTCEEAEPGTEATCFVDYYEQDSE